MAWSNNSISFYHSHLLGYFLVVAALEHFCCRVWLLFGCFWLFLAMNDFSIIIILYVIGFSVLNSLDVRTSSYSQGQSCSRRLCGQYTSKIVAIEHLGHVLSKICGTTGLMFFHQNSHLPNGAQIDQYLAQGAKPSIWSSQPILYLSM